MAVWAPGVWDPELLAIGVWDGDQVQPPQPPAGSGGSRRPLLRPRPQPWHQTAMGAVMLAYGSRLASSKPAQTGVKSS
jgi:hypothetical protein